ncbi:hypothetical protein BHM03_00051333 [Ensete ventricosum]|nr:hypothetical protein BHM03_00051333 [Ensete ventricosum]
MIRPSRSSGDGLAEMANSGTNPSDLAERTNLGTNPGDLAEKVNLGTNPGDLAERANLDTNPRDLAKGVSSSINPGDLAEGVNSDTNPGGLAERANSGTNPGDLAEMANLGTNPRDLAEGVNSGTNPGDLAEGELVGITSSNSSSSVRVISSPGSGGVSLGDLEANPAGASDAPGMCISVDALEASLPFPLHPLIEECLRWWRISPSQVAPNSWRYLVVFLGECRGAGIIPTRDLFMACFRLCKSRGGYYLTIRVGFRVSGALSNNKGWKSRYLFVSGPVWGFRLDWLAHPIGNTPPYLSEEESVLVDKLKGILSSSCAIKEMTELWLVEAGLSPTSRDRMNLGELREMPKVSGGKASSTRTTAREVGKAPSTRTAAREVDVSPAREAPKASSKRSIDAPTEQADDPARRHKKVKVLTRRHKSRHDEGESRSHSKDKKPAAPSEEPDMPVESDERGASPVHHRPRSMKDLFKTKVHKDDAGYYTLQMSDLGHQGRRMIPITK